LTNAQLRVLLAMWAAGGGRGRYHGTVRQLAQMMPTTSGTLGAQVAQLRRAGWVGKEPEGWWSVRLSRAIRAGEPYNTRTAEPRDPRGSAARSARVSRTPQPPTGVGGRARRRTRGRRAAPEGPQAKHPAAIEPYLHPGCAVCDQTGFVVDSEGRMARCPDLERPA
jgi:hypothetical protein